MAINKEWHLKHKMPTRLPAPKRSDGGQENPTFDTLKKIAKALEISVDELIK